MKIHELSVTILGSETVDKYQRVHVRYVATGTEDWIPAHALTDDNSMPLSQESIDVIMNRDHMWLWLEHVVRVAHESMRDFRQGYGLESDAPITARSAFALLESELEKYREALGVKP
jgi:hypothetical protein